MNRDHMDQSSLEIRPGDVFSIDIQMRRRWWQFRKPLQWKERQLFVAIDQSEAGGSAIIRRYDWLYRLCGTIFRSTR